MAAFEQQRFLTKEDKNKSKRAGHISGSAIRCTALELLFLGTVEMTSEGRSGHSFFLPAFNNFSIKEGEIKNYSDSAGSRLSTININSRKLTHCSKQTALTSKSLLIIIVD